MTKTKVNIKFASFFVILFILHYEGYSQKYTLPNRILSIVGYKPGRIPQSILNQAKQIDIKSPYTFISAEIYIGDTTGNKCVHSRPLTENTFDEAISKALYNLNLRGLNLISFGSIKVMDKDGQMMDVEDAFFIISKN